MYWCVVYILFYYVPINENFTWLIFSFEQNVAKVFKKRKKKSLKPNARIKIT